MAIQKQSVVPARDRYGLKHPKTPKQIEQRAAALAASKAAKAAA